MGELEIPLIVGRHGHDGSGAVAREDVVGDPNGNIRPGHRVDGKGAGPDPGFVFGEFGALEVGLRGSELLVLRHRGCLRRRGEARDEPVLRRQHHISRPE